MNFAQKIFITSLAIATVSCTLITIIIYSIFKKDIEVEFLNRYKADQSIISNTFHQLEVASDNSNKNAVILLSEIEKIHGIPTNKELDDLAKKLGVNGFYVIDRYGKFIRSSDIPVKLQHNSLYSYDPGYKNLINGTLDIAITPIIPSYPYDVPAKLTMIPNHNRTLILESSTHLEYIEKILHQVVVADKNIKSIGLYAPTGYELGSISSDGHFYQGRRDINKKLFLGNKIIGENLTISTEIPLDSKYCLECKNKGVSQDGEYYYILTFQVSLITLLARLNVLKIQVGLIFAFMLIMSGILSIIISQKLVSRIKKINKTVNNIIESKNLESQVAIKGNDEISKLAIAFNKMIIALKCSQNELIETEKIRSMGKIANQVAHDIRSPLAAISTVISTVASIAENKRIIIRNASKRINDIANNLLLQYKSHFMEISQDNFEKDEYPELLFIVLENIVSEKRYEYYNRQINIQLNVSRSSYNCFANINLTSFKRVLSNLINNSVEASNLNGVVILYLKSDVNKVEIIIQDNGCGISPEVLPKVTEQGFSFNKKNGAGFGLSYAKKYIEELSGEMIIHSEINVGTEVTINLIRSDHPQWFCETLNIKPHSVIIVIDDDTSIHDVWDERLAHVLSVNIIHFFKASDLTQDKIDNLKADLYLVDYELLADNVNGLDVIENLKLNKQSILVTSCFEDLTVRNRCEKLNIKIIPKSYVPYIPVLTFSSKQKNNSVIFIDNDELMRTIWAFAAEEAGINISTFSSHTEFNNEMHHYPKDTIIYIDSDLGNNIKGELYAKKLFLQGFTEIYLATGHQPDHFDNMPLIKSIIGKEPPFLPLQENTI